MHNTAEDVFHSQELPIAPKLIKHISLPLSYRMLSNFP